MPAKHKQTTKKPSMSDNIQVVVRCRARTEREIAAKSANIISLPNDEWSAHEPLVSVDSTTTLSINPIITPETGKVFRVDQVFGKFAEQKLVFEKVAMPLVEDWFKGMNVTILAYGQTGSGKTYTMCGDLKGEHAGIIPRVLHSVFNSLSDDFMLKLSCVELYKEELHDLINNEVDMVPVRSKLRLVSDNSKAQNVTIQNLLHVNIDNSEMGFQVLQKCLARRRTSVTNLNDQSSRSHTIFSLNLYRKHGTGDGQMEYRVLKLNLVDLAGSEDIHKSGAVNERAREAGSINQSLLSLGKVINALSEGKELKHIPYRESKLTRLLQGSIGGKTRTALIATISPARLNLQETLSTLNYASKAKSIKNLPQSSHEFSMVLKKTLIGDLSAQVARLMRDIMAAKDKDGFVKISALNYEKHQAHIAYLEAENKEKDSQIKYLSSQLSELKEKKDIAAERAAATERENFQLKEKQSSDLDKLLQALATSGQLQQKFETGQQRLAEQEHKLRNCSDSLKNLIDTLAGHQERSENLFEGSRDKTSNEFETYQALIEASFYDMIHTLKDNLPDFEQPLKEHTEFIDAVARNDAVTEADVVLNYFRKFREQVKEKLLSENFAQIQEEVRATHEKSLEEGNVKLLSTFQMLLESRAKKDKERFQELLEHASREQLTRACFELTKSSEADLDKAAHITASMKHKQAEIRGRAHTLKSAGLVEKACAQVITVMNEGVENSLRNLASEHQVASKRIKEDVLKRFESIESEIVQSSKSGTQKLTSLANALADFEAEMPSLCESGNENASPHKPGLKRLRPLSPMHGADKKKRKPLVERSENNIYHSRIPLLLPSKSTI